jgi:site-specific DNA-adenine methylase
MNYGIPYQGSKSKIAKKIIGLLPSAENFYDLFAGGCAITHCAILRLNTFFPKWKNFIINDLGNTPKLFLDAIRGKYRDEKRFITREMFKTEMAKPFYEQDPYIKYIWSFGNNGVTYLFGKDVELIKHKAHDYLMINGYDGTREKRIELVRRFKREYKITDKFELQQLEQLERLQQLERLEIYKCDPPYQDTMKYDGQNIDYDEFWQWCYRQETAVYISSYKILDKYVDKFKIVGEWLRKSTMQGGSNRRKNHPTEKLYWNNKVVKYKNN